MRIWLKKWLWIFRGSAREGWRNEGGRSVRRKGKIGEGATENEGSGMWNGLGSVMAESKACVLTRDLPTYQSQASWATVFHLTLVEASGTGVREKTKEKGRGGEEHEWWMMEKAKRWKRRGCKLEIHRGVRGGGRREGREKEDKSEGREEDRR